MQVLLVFLISGFHQVLNIVCVLLGISPASVWVLPMFRNPLLVPSSRAGSKYDVWILRGVWLYIIYSQTPRTIQTSYLLPALEDGTDRGFRNVGRTQTDARDIPKRTHTILLVLFIWFQSCTIMTSRIGHMFSLISRVLEKETLYLSKLLVSTYKTAWHHKQEITAGTVDAMKAWRFVHHWCNYLLLLHQLRVHQLMPRKHLSPGLIVHTLSAPFSTV